MIWKFAKKVVGTGVAVILSVALLIGGGVLTLGQVRNFMEASGIVVKEGWATATEDGGSAFIYWIQDLIDDEEYTKMLDEIVGKKRKTIKNGTDYEIRAKLLRHALSRGFEYNLVASKLNI